jgi:protein-tyrosine-phosphatase
MTQKTYNILFLCRANSARSLMAEAIMQREGLGKFRAFSAGSHPANAPNADAMSLLARENFDVSLFRSKSWDVFAGPDAPQMDFVVTVCDTLAGEECPVWPGQPMQAHWGVHDPVAFKGNEAHTAVIFAKTYAQLRNRITVFANLPFDALDQLSLKKQMDEIGELVEGRDD